MNNSQRLQVRSSEIRAKLNTLAGIDAPTDEQAAELATLTTEYQSVELRMRAAIIAEGGNPDGVKVETVDAETRERIEIRGKSRVGAYLLAALQGRLPGGAEAEYSAALGTAGGEIPLDLWEHDRPAPSAEVRAATPAPSTGTGVTVAPVQPFIFAPSVGSGGYSELTISTSVPAAPMRATPPARSRPSTQTRGASVRGCLSRWRTSQPSVRQTSRLRYGRTCRCR